MASKRLGVDLDNIIYRQGDTDLLPSGRGSGGSAATVIGGSAVYVALNEFIEAGKSVASGVLAVILMPSDLRRAYSTIRGIKTETQ